MAITNFSRLIKPRLFMSHGVWCCRAIFLTFRVRIVGYGYTPAQAYDDWKQQIEAS